MELRLKPVVTRTYHPPAVTDTILIVLRTLITSQCRSEIGYRVSPHSVYQKTMSVNVEILCRIIDQETCTIRSNPQSRRSSFFPIKTNTHNCFKYKKLTSV